MAGRLVAGTDQPACHLALPTLSKELIPSAPARLQVFSLDTAPILEILSQLHPGARYIPATLSCGTYPRARAARSVHDTGRMTRAPRGDLTRAPRDDRHARYDPLDPGVRAGNSAAGASRPYLTECIDLLVLEGRLSHKIVNLLFTFPVKISG